MKQTTIDLYEHSDLIKPENQSIKDSVIEKYRHINVDYDSWYCIDDIIEASKTKGFEIEKMYYSGFWSPSDGAMFEGNFMLNSDSDIELIKSYVNETKVAKLIKNGYIRYSVWFNHRGRNYNHKCYDYSYCIETKEGFSIDRYPRIKPHVDIIDQVREDYESICKDIYNSLENQYDSLTSEASVMETIEANGYTFDSSGKMYNL